MSLTEIEQAVDKLTAAELAKLAAYIACQDKLGWDQELDEDFSPGGKHSETLKKIDAEIDAGKFTPMPRSPMHSLRSGSATESCPDTCRNSLIKISPFSKPISIIPHWALRKKAAFTLSRLAAATALSPVNAAASSIGSGSGRTRPTTTFVSSPLRIVIFASEDVGLADPEALPLAIATQQAVEFVGLPEARIPLAHATAYMCRAKKSREAYETLGAATEEIENERTERVPENLKNKHFPVNPEG